MSSLSNVEARLPPGFRFHPRDEELVCEYLMKWVNGCPLPFPSLVQVDLNKCEPWDIPESACIGGKEWYFYSQRDRKYATGLRTNRATVSGYWKATGKDRPVVHRGTLVGMRKTLVFYQGRAPKGRKTDWVMHEFRLIHGPGPKAGASVKEDWVLCRVFFKSRRETPGRQATGDAYEVTPSSPSLPPLMEPYMTAAYDVQTEASASDHQYHEQVPCFSIFSSCQTSPNFPDLDPPAILPSRLMPGFGGMLQPADQLGIYNSVNASSAWDNLAMKSHHHHLTEMTGANVKGSPSFGEGSPDSYLSEVGLSSMWNVHCL